MKTHRVMKAGRQALAMAFSVAIVSTPFAQQPPQGGVAAVAPQAAKTIAKLSKLEGDILASTETGLLAVGEGAAFRKGTRVMTMAKTSARIDYEDGCVVEMKPNMRAVIDDEESCDKRAAWLVMPDPSAVALAPTSVPSLVLGGELGSAAAFGAAVGVGVIRWRQNDPSVSPN